MNEMRAETKKNGDEGPGIEMRGKEEWEKCCGKQQWRL